MKSSTELVTWKSFILLLVIGLFGAGLYIFVNWLSPEGMARSTADRHFESYKTAKAINQPRIACSQLEVTIGWAIDTHDVEYAKGFQGIYDRECAQ